MLLKTLLLFCSLILLAGSALAAEIYGQLWDTAKRAPRGAIISTDCGAEAAVDHYGRYRLTDLPLRKTCTLSINYKQRTSNPVNIYTGSNRNSANFMLKISGDRLLLIRR